MNKAAWFAIMPLVACLSFSCASNSDQSQADYRPHFHEAAEASVILQFNSWNYIFLVKPEYREKGFIRALEPIDLDLAFSQLGVRRDMAVVELGWTYNNTELAELMDEWKAMLTYYGFKRMVFVRESNDGSIDGSIVLDDTQLPVTPQKPAARLQYSPTL